MRLKLIEPLSMLFKDEVRELGLRLGLRKDVVSRQPFPGPGLAIRIIGAVTEEKLKIVSASDAILHEEIARAGLKEHIWQYFTVLTPVKTVGVMGDQRTYDHVLVIRAVTSIDGMTADWAHIPYDVLSLLSTRMINEISGIKGDNIFFAAERISIWKNAYISIIFSLNFIICCWKGFSKYI